MNTRASLAGVKEGVGEVGEGRGRAKWVREAGRERGGDRGEVEVQGRIYGCNNGISAAGPLTRRHFPSSSSHYRMDGTGGRCACVPVDTHTHVH